MHKIIHFTFLSISLTIIPFILTAQVCQVDSFYKDSVGVFPAPVTPENPNGGIDEAACIGQDYSFTMTVRIPEQISLTFGGVPITVNILSASIDPENAIEGLPPGLDYACSNPNCSFEPNELGCIRVSGTVPEGTAAGRYDLTLTIEVVVDGLGAQQIDFPGQQFPGEYFIDVVEPGDSRCIVSNEDKVLQELSLYPNPIKSGQDLQLETDQYMEYELYNQVGTLIKVGTTQNQISTQSLPAGSYLLRLTSDKGFAIKRFVVLP